MTTETESPVTVDVVTSLSQSPLSSVDVMTVSNSNSICAKSEDNGTTNVNGTATVTPFSITDILTKMENREVNSLPNSGKRELLQKLDTIHTIAAKSKSDSNLINKPSFVQFDSNETSSISPKADISYGPTISPIDLTKDNGKALPEREYSQGIKDINANNNLKSNFTLSKNNSKYLPLQDFTTIGESTHNALRMRDLSKLTHFRSSNVKPQANQSLIEQRLHQARMEVFGMTNRLTSSSNTTFPSNRSQNGKAVLPNHPVLDTHSDISVSSTVPALSPPAQDRMRDGGSISPASNASMEDMEGSEQDDETDVEVKQRNNRCEATSSDQRRESEERGECIVG